MALFLQTDIILQREPPYLPPDGQSLKTRSISVTNVKVKTWDDSAGHFKDSTKATETVIQCSDKHKVNNPQFTCLC